MDLLTNSAQDAISLLGLRNRCLEKIHRAATDFYALRSSPDRLPASIELERYDAKRQALFKTLRFFDRKLASSPIPTPEAIEKERHSWMSRIRELDALVQAWLEEAMSALSREIQASEKNKALLQRFKSAPTEPALDQTL